MALTIDGLLSGGESLAADFRFGSGHCRQAFGQKLIDRVALKPLYPSIASLQVPASFLVARAGWEALRRRAGTMIFIDKLVLILAGVALCTAFTVLWLPRERHVPETASE